MARAFAFRADASRQIGLGHVTRCLALAEALVAEGASACLVHRALDIDLSARIASAGVTELVLPPPRNLPISDAVPHASWACVPWLQDASETIESLAEQSVHRLVVDHYAFDARWHRHVRAAIGCRVAVIDDLGDRELDCDTLIDHNHADDHQAKYKARLPAGVVVFGGPRYALLGLRYLNAPRYVFNETISSIGIFMGGVDGLNASALAVRACRLAGYAGAIEIATTVVNPHLTSLKRLAAQDGRTEIGTDQPDLCAFFARHDLQIGASGGATWERLCIGAPTLAVITADNQRQVLLPLLASGAIQAIQGSPPELDDLARGISHLLHCPADRRRMADLSKQIVDGRGTQRIARVWTEQ